MTSGSDMEILRKYWQDDSRACDKAGPLRSLYANGPPDVADSDSDFGDVPVR